MNSEPEGSLETARWGGTKQVSVEIQTGSGVRPFDKQAARSSFSFLMKALMPLRSQLAEQLCLLKQAVTVLFWWVRARLMA